MFIILASFIIFIIWLTYRLKKQENLEKSTINDFWEKEHTANQVRKKPLDDLDFVTIPFAFIPPSLLSDHETVKDCLGILEELSGKKIVNLTGYSNTDLKLQYGAANLTLLSEYDENYTLFARTIYQLARTYYENGYVSNARILLEKAVESGTDIRANYLLLADIYKAGGEPQKIEALIQRAKTLKSASANTIIHSLEESAHKS